MGQYNHQARIMDLLIAIPRAQSDVVREMLTCVGRGTMFSNEDKLVFWTLRHEPTRFEPTDRVWFQIDNLVVGFVRIVKQTDEDMTCEVTGELWRGWHLFWRVGDVELLPEPIAPKKPLMRGFRYWGQQP